MFGSILKFVLQGRAQAITDGIQGPALVPLVGVQGAKPPEALRF